MVLSFLGRMVKVLDYPVKNDHDGCMPVPSRTAAEPRVGAMLRVVSNRVRDQVHEAVVAAGFDDLNPAHLAMFRYPGLDGTRPSHLAVELGVTKQAVNLLAGHLESCGYITREPDPLDGRGRVIRLSTRGRSVERTIHEHARIAEDHIAAILGEASFERFRRELERLFRSVAGGDG